MAETAHQRIDRRPTSGLRSILLQPLSKGRVQGLVLRSSYQPRLLDKTLVGAQRNVFHTSIVYTGLVCTAISARYILFLDWIPANHLE